MENKKRNLIMYLGLGISFFGIVLTIFSVGDYKEFKNG
tara:strand:+ start:181 stop:294 length:114 start_codon:yes stop_codon:yes gene_type:complete